MPHIVYGQIKRRDYSSSSVYNYDYLYPGEFNFKPGTDLHNKIVDRILEFADFSSNEAKKHHPKMKKLDDTLTAYIPADEAEEEIKEDDSRKPVSIVFPFSYAILDSMLTYLMMAFIKDPIFEYEGVGAEDERGAILIQSIIAQNCRRSKVAIALMQTMRNALVYNKGYGLAGWEIKTGRRQKVEANISTTLEGNVEGTPYRKSINTTLYEGNNFQPMNPYLVLPDPTVPPTAIQKGQFFGWVEQENLMSLKGKENAGNDGLFNIKYLSHLKQFRFAYITSDATSTNNDSIRANSNDIVNNMLTEQIDIISMYIKIIPKEWELGDSEIPELWLFRVGADSVLIQAEAIDLDHDSIPVVCASPEDDGRSPNPISKIETLYGLQEVGDWMFNSHIANVRKSINNMLIVDPNLINMNDLRKPGAGKLVRLRRPAWGKGVEGAIKQLKVDDITRANVADSQIIQGIMSMIAGTDASMMGALRQGGPERLTGKEFAGTRGAAMSRLERLAMIFGMQFIQDIGYLFAYHTQQFMSQDTVTRIVGDLPESLENELGIGQAVAASITDILVDFDIVVRDGSIPGSNFSDAWPALFETLTNNPDLMQEFHMGRIFSYMARNMGAKNVHQFKKGTEQIAQNISTISDGEAEKQVQAGNLVPYGGPL
jgi:hypothetical protein